MSNPKPAATIKVVRPADLADELGVDAKLIRSFLRREFTRDATAKNTSWHLTPNVCDAVRDHFIPTDEVEELEDDES